MTNISKVALSPKVESQLQAQFTQFFAKAPKGSRGGLYTDLFTTAEKIMFLKRLAIIFLLDKGCSTYDIAFTLHVSDATARMTRRRKDNGEYDHILSIMHARSFNVRDFVKTIEIILQAGLPPRGKGRWKWLYEMEETPILFRKNKG